MARGYGHRKLYPYVTKGQLKDAPGIGRFVNRNRAELERQGNQILKAPGTMRQTDSKSPLKSKWKRMQDSQRAKMGRGGGGTKRSIDRRVVGAHSVHFGADPKNR